MSSKRYKRMTLVDGEGLEEYGLKTGMVGEITGTTTMTGQKLVFFRPEKEVKIFAIDSKRVKPEGV